MFGLVPVVALGDMDMLTLMWANEVFDPAHPDTLRRPVLETPAEAKEND